MLLLLFLNLGVICLHISHAEIFTAMADFETLLDGHKKFIDNLEAYTEMQEKKLFIIKGYLDVYSREQVRAKKDIPKYLNNPVNVFIIIKRLVSDLNYLFRIVGKGSDYVLKVLSDHENTVYPDRNDLIGAAEALGRLQKTYNLDARDLANGNLNNIAYSSPMTASDCYVLSQALTIERNYLEAGRVWMIEALRRYNLENISYPFKNDDVMQYITNANNILEEESVRTEEDSTPDEESQEDIKKREEFAHYEALCRGEVVLSTKVSSRLTCFYLTKNHPFLKIAPLKVEMKHLNPDIFLFHDVLTDDEIRDIKEIGRPLLQRAEAFDDNVNDNIFVSYRISKLAWLVDEDSKLINRISQRVSDMTGLSIEYAEPLQLCNYGIGGHYEPHLDFSMKLKHGSTEYEERIATTLFYMSDVDQGGATVFPKLGLTIYPKKGTAIFWFNMYPSGAGNKATLHAACPVLKGDKWVSSKWIHQYGQEFIRPCNLKYQEDSI